MTRDDAKILWPIIKAWSEGEEIQMCSYLGGPWGPLDLERPNFNSGAEYYRIKPEPVECWAVMGNHHAPEYYESQAAAEDHADYLRVHYNAKARVVKLREVED